MTPLPDRLALHARKVERFLAIVERCLRKTFPEDYHKRCAYAAFGVRALLRKAGAGPVIVGGDFAAFIVARDNRRAGLAGFAFGQDQCSHFWVECQDRLIDVGPSFLPCEASYPVARMPAFMWPLTEPLPVYARYRPQVRFSDADQLSADPVVADRAERFVRLCLETAAAHRGHLAFPGGVVTGEESVRAVARRGDLWASAALRFARMVDRSTLPF